MTTTITNNLAYEAYQTYFTATDQPLVTFDVFNNNDHLLTVWKNVVQSIFNFAGSATIAA